MAEEDAAVATFMKYFGDDHDKMKRGEDNTIYVDITEEEQPELYEEKSNALNQSRVYSLESFRKLFDAVGKRSTIQVELDDHTDKLNQLLDFQAKTLK